MKNGKKALENLNPLVWFLSSVMEGSETGAHYIMNGRERNPLNIPESLHFNSDIERILRALVTVHVVFRPALTVLKGTNITLQWV